VNLRHIISLPGVKAALLAFVGAVVSALAFPPVGPGWLVFVGVAVFLTGLRMSASARQGLAAGAVYGLVFFGGLMWWLSELGLIAVIPLVIVQSAFFAGYGWAMARHNGRPAPAWALIGVGGWAVMELVRHRFPLGGLEWGAVGYALSDQAWVRAGAPLVGAAGWTALVAAVGAGLAVLAADRVWAPVAAALLLVFFVSSTGAAVPGPADREGPGVEVAVVQGSTPCPFEHCPPNERLRTYEQHLELTGTIPAGSVELVVWSEGSTGSTNADPVLNPEVGEAIGAEARRIGAWVLVGGDRPVSDEEWVNANVLFNPDGEIVGEYRKQHPVPFGERIPLRPLFEWIPDLDAVPRDMIAGEGPAVFRLDGYNLGGVISFEGSFARYARQHVAAGAQVIAVLTNGGSYGFTPASDQLIGMTRMRAAELGVYVIHAAVTGKSAVIDGSGELVGEASGLGAEEVVRAAVAPRRGAKSPYALIGDSVMYVAAVVGAAAWLRWRASAASDNAQPSSRRRNP